MTMDLFYKAAGAVLAPFRYAQREIENTKEDLKEEARRAVSTVLKISLVVFCLLLSLLFGSIAAASIINASMNSAWAGFAIVGGFYLVLAFCMYAWKKASDKMKYGQEHQHHPAKTATA